MEIPIPKIGDDKVCGSCFSSLADCDVEDVCYYTGLTDEARKKVYLPAGKDLDHPDGAWLSYDGCAEED